MRRTVDRVEAWSTLLLLAVLLVGAPMLAWRVGGSVYGTPHPAGHPERFPARAVLVQDAPAVATGAVTVVRPRVPARAEWTAPDGSVHRGQVVVEAGTPAGTTVAVVTDAAGRLVDPAEAGTGSAGQAAIAGVLAGLCLALGLGCTWGILRFLLYRRRLARWQAGWRRVEPRWRGMA